MCVRGHLQFVCFPCAFLCFSPAAVTYWAGSVLLTPAPTAHVVQHIFGAMSECQALHPDPEEDVDGEMQFGEEQQQLGGMFGAPQIGADGLTDEGRVLADRFAAMLVGNGDTSMDQAADGEFEDAD
eukprot:m.89796 g.89796  ORF g.89796 m.89796 type:complete len:126 (-) comp14986_c1_seq1:105-482(-)